MKKLGILSTIIVFAALIYAFKGGETYETIKIGATAPMTDVQMNATNGEQVSLQSAKGVNGTLVIFSCNTCPFVIAWEDRYPEIADWANETEVGFVLVNSNEAKRNGDDSMEEMREHAESKGYPSIPYLVDSESALANEFGAKTTPHVFLFDSNWKLVYEGAIDDNHKSKDEVKSQYLRNAMKNLQSGGKIDPSNTKAMGCSIKRVNI